MKLFFRRGNTGFTMLPNHIITSPEISCQEKALLFLLYYHAGQDTHCWAYQSTLAKELGISTRYIRKILKRLEKKELVILQQRGLNRSNTYYLNEKPMTNKIKSGISELDRNHSSTPDRTYSSGPRNNTVGNNTFKRGDLKKYKNIRDDKLYKSGFLKAKQDLAKSKSV
jgi:Uncharacterized membrane-associated protein/domain